MVIDTNIFIEYLRAKNKHKTTLYKLPDTAKLYLSAITQFELLAGATSEEKWNDVIKLTKDLTILPISEQVATKAAKIYQQLRTENKLIEFRDILIAATAIINNEKLLTLNKKHFSRITGLELY